MVKQNKQLFKDKDQDFKSFQKLVYVKAENLAKILTNYILLSAHEARAAV